MRYAAIIGAGQLGSRHLQALALHEKPLTIYIVDPFEESLKISQQRFTEVDQYHNKTLHFIRFLDELPLLLDFVIIATNSLQRLEVMKKILQLSHVRYLLLEKFLFPKINEYDLALELIASKQVKAYVNCARRMWPSYQELSTSIDRNSSMHLNVTGSNWNLASNAIHFIDLFFYLTNDELITLNTSGLDESLIENKRPGYIEFTGTLKGHTPSGNKLSLTSTAEESSTPKIRIETDQRVWIIDENNQEIKVGDKVKKFPMYYQSQLTHKVFEQLMESETCNLVTFERSAQDHLILLKAFTAFLNGREGSIT